MSEKKIINRTKLNLVIKICSFCKNEEPIAITNDVENVCICYQCIAKSLMAMGDVFQ